jgi:hypothetical protein
VSSLKPVCGVARAKLARLHDKRGEKRREAQEKNWIGEETPDTAWGRIHDCLHTAIVCGASISNRDSVLTSDAECLPIPATRHSAKRVYCPELPHEIRCGATRSLFLFLIYGDSERRGLRCASARCRHSHCVGVC